MRYFKQKWYNWRFLIVMSIGCILSLVNPCVSFALNKDIDSLLVKNIVTNTIGIDTHNHIDVPLKAVELPGPNVNLAEEITKSGLSAICMTFAVDYQKLNYDSEAWDRFLNGLTAMDTILVSNNMTRSYNLIDIEEAHSAQRPTVIQAIEGGHFLEGKIERLQVAYDRGLRHLGLLHDNDASVPLGDVFTNEPQWGGLTPFGAEVVKNSERLGILIDLSHCDDNTIDGVLKVATKPIMVSHTGLDTQLGNNDFMAKMMKPRLISKETARKVADAGGVIGVWTHLADTPDEFVDNIKAMVDVVGIDHVAIGTDTKLTPAYHSPSDSWGMPNEKKAEDIHFNNKQKRESDPTQKDLQNSKQKPQGGEGTNVTWPNQEQGFYYVVVEALLKKGFNEDEIGKIGGGNYLRIFDIATKGH